jgi:PAS domain S-box-containing protein
MHSSALEALPHILWQCNAFGERTFTNARWTEETGLPAADALGWRWIQNAVHPEDRERVRERWRRRLSSPADFSYEARLIDARTGCPRTFLSKVRPLYEDGRLSGWLGTDTEIDERARGEAALRVLVETTTRLASSLDADEAYAALLEALVPDGADWAFAAAVDTAGEARIVAVSRARDEASRVARALRGATLESTAPALEAARTSLPCVATAVAAEWLGVQPPELGAAFAGLDLDSAITAPIRLDYRNVGLIAAFRRNPAPRYVAADLPLFCELARRLALALHNAETYEHERRVAATFQRAALPQMLPERTDLLFDAVYEAGRSEALVGGDWYDAVQLLGGRVLVSIGDVSGSGLSAAVTMGLMRQSIRAVAQTTPDPVAILDAADRTLRAHDPERIVTAFVGVLDPFTGELAYASAGHPPAFLRAADGSVTELWASGLPLGLRGKHVRSETATVAVPRDALLVLYTDGLTEATRDVLEGEARLRAALAQPSLFDHEMPAKALRRRLLPNGSRDDVAILAVRVLAQPAIPEPGRAPRTWRFRAEDMERAVSARHEFAALLTASDFAPDEVAAAQLVFGELLGNAIRHATGTIEASLVWVGANPVLHLLDDGPGYRSEVPQLPAQFSENGRGLFIVASIAEDFSVVRRARGGSHARAVLPASRAARRRTVAAPNGESSGVTSSGLRTEATAAESLRAPS